MEDQKISSENGGGDCLHGEDKKKDIKLPNNLTKLSLEQEQKMVNLFVVWRARIPYIMDRNFRRVMFEKYGLKQVGAMLKILLVQYLEEQERRT